MNEYITEDELRIKLHELVEGFLGELEENDIIEQIAILSEKIYHGFGRTLLGGSPVFGFDRSLGRLSRWGNFFTTSREAILNSHNDLNKSNLKFTCASREFLDGLEKR